MNAIAQRALAPVRTLVVPALLVLVVPLLFESFRLTQMTTVATYLITALGFNIVFGYSGTISFGHAAFALVGAYTAALGQVRYEWGFLQGTVTAALLCAVLGAVTALPTLRMAPFAIAVITLLFLPALTSAIQYFSSFTLGGDGVPAFSELLSTEEQWYLVATIAAVAWLVCRNLIRSPMGRAWEVSRVAPELAESLGVGVTGVRLAAVALSAGLAGLAGALWPLLNGFTSPETFNLGYAVLILVLVVIGGQASVNGPVAGAVVIAAITIGLNEFFAEGGAAVSIVYALLVLAVVLVAPGGAVEIVHRVTGLVARRISRAPAEPPVPETAEADAVEDVVAGTMPATDGATLAVRGVSWHVGGARILTDVAMTARPGTVHGLIGPNGAGKTSLLNCICGYLVADGGSITLDGTPITGRPSKRMRAGISRTFQQPALLDGHTTLQNVLPGVDSHRRRHILEYVFRLPTATREARAAEAEARRWLDVVGLAAVHDLEARRLGPGQRRQLEIARALATRPKVLLMDEPAAGLTTRELRIVERIIRSVADRGVAVVLIEHHFDLVQRVCDEVTVLDAGAVIFAGSPADAARDRAVVEAYLGVEEPQVEQEGMR